MTTGTDRIQAIFQDARGLQADALEMLALGDIRNAAEKAWGATKRASDALVLARTGAEPGRPAETALGLRQLQTEDAAVGRAHLVDRYYSRQAQLHGECFYAGLCDPLEDTERRIRETSGYIEDAQSLAAGLGAVQGDSLATLFGVDIIRIIKYLGDPSVYCMETKQGKVTIGGIERIYSQPKFRQSVGEATRIVIPTVSGKVWDQRVQAILQACEEVEAGDVSHPMRETRRWVTEYLLEKPPREEDWERAAATKSPFVKQGITHLFIDGLRRWLECTVGLLLDDHKIGRRLREIRMDPRQVNVHVGGKRTTRTAWVVPEECLPDRAPQPGDGRTHMPGCQGEGGGPDGPPDVTPDGPQDGQCGRTPGTG